VPVAWLLLKWRKERLDDRIVLGRYFILAGLLRFAIEFIRVNRHVVGPLTVAHLASLLAIAIGAGLLAGHARRVEEGT